MVKKLLIGIAYIFLSLCLFAGAIGSAVYNLDPTNAETASWTDDSDSTYYDGGSSSDSGWFFGGGDSWDSGSDSGGWDSWDSGSDSGSWDSWDSGSDSGSWDSDW